MEDFSGEKPDSVESSCAVAFYFHPINYNAPCFLNLPYSKLPYVFYLVMIGLPIDEFSRKKMDATAQELSEEKALAYSCLE